MHFFTDYIQPLTLWLSYHPHWALLITFLISFSESLAIIGSIIPGSVTMTAIGILAGSGVMRIDFTLLAATLGAIAGDTGSYTLGYIFSDRLINIWPFNRYPTWLAYGKLYFEKHGSTSVLIGRFVGPMRSIIPVIAGMMQMNQWHFLLANILSGIAWAMLYVLPGVLIGAAGSLLSTESTTHLFALILMFLVIVWLLGLGLKWLLLLINQFLNANLHQMWLHLKKHPLFRTSARYLAPKHEIYHYNTAALTCLWLFSFIMSIIMTAFILQSFLANAINNPVYLFLQSLRMPSLDSFFIVLALIISPIPLFMFFLSFALYTIYYRDWRTLSYWVSLCLSTSLVILFLIRITGNQETGDFLLRDYTLQVLSIIDLTMATALFCFFIFYISTYLNTITQLTLRIILLSILCLSGIGFIYLGDNWLANIMAAYFLGLTLSLTHWIFYRRTIRQQHRSQLLIYIACLVFVLTSLISCRLYFNKLVRMHSTELPQYVMIDNAWWNQQHPLLPLYTTNRIGKRTGILNIQYAGSITVLAKTLKIKGWKLQSTSFLKSLILRAGGTPSAEELPLMAQLYLNRKPTLTMTYDPGNQQTLLVLRLWRSNYHLRHYHEPLWIGNLARRTQYKSGTILSHQAIAIHNEMLRSLPQFRFKQIGLPKPYLKSLPYVTSNVLLLIKQPNDPE